MKTFIVKTSILGYGGTVYQVETNMPLSEFQNIDNKYGMKSRNQSTTISQLKEGAEKEGHTFDFSELLPYTQEWDKIQQYKHDYFANYGNY